MTNLERFRRITGFQKPDRCPRWYTLGFWDEVGKKWHEENGIPDNIDLMKYFKLEFPVLSDLPGNLKTPCIPYSPPYQTKIIREDEENKVIQGEDGIIYKHNMKSAGKQFLSFPVKTEEDWAKVKQRLDPDMHDYGADYAETVKMHLDNEDPNSIFICGIYGFHRNLMGEENLAYAYYDMPDVVLDMSEHWLKFYSRICCKLIKDMRIDFIAFFEDMAYKTGPLIGPNLFKKFMTPFYRQMIEYLKDLNMRVFMVDCDGNIDQLLPLFMEVGINMMDPFEQAAGNDIFSIRENYPGLVMWGGIDKRVLFMSREDIKREVYGKVPVMWEKGGFIPSIDHSTPPCPMDNFAYYLELMTEICG